MCFVEYDAAIKNKEFMKFLEEWIDLEDIIMIEVTQSQKDTCDMHPLIYAQEKNCWIFWQNYVQFTEELPDRFPDLLY